MTDLLEHLINFYHMRFIPTVKRMCDRRRIAFTLLTIGVLVLSALVLSLLTFSVSNDLNTLAGLDQEYQAYLDQTITSENGSASQSVLPEIRDMLAVEKAEIIASALFGGVMWLLLSVLAIGRVMSSVIESESYVYGLFMIYGSGYKQLRKQLSLEFLLAGVFALLLGIPGGYGVYVAITGSLRFPLEALWVVITCFLLLILVCAMVLARRVLRRSCMRMLNSADTSEFTVSPRRSHLGGLTKKRSTVASALLAIWRMRKHYISLAITIAVMAAMVCGVLAPSGTVSEGGRATYTLEFPQGIDSDTLSWNYVYPLGEQEATPRFQYGIANTAEALGTHVRLSERQNGLDGGIFLGERYATDSVRIACGDGDTFFELGGNIIIPEEFRHMQVPDRSEYGYKLDAVPSGCATYVYPQGTTPPLSLHAGDTIQLYLPSETAGSVPDRVDREQNYLTVTVTSVVEIPSLYVKRGGPEICPRITEDYLYLNPFDFELFDGEIHAQAVIAEEAYPADLFAKENTCILVVPQKFFDYRQFPTHVTVISPEDTVKIPFGNGQIKESLPMDDYFVNFTSRGVGIYLGTEAEYLMDIPATEAMTDLIKNNLGELAGDLYLKTVRREYEIEQVIFTDYRGHPFLLLPNGDEINYSSLQFDVCAFRMGHASSKSSQLMSIIEESYLTETDRYLGPTFYQRYCYLGTALLPDFVASMEKHGIPLQFPEEWFTSTETVIRNSFSLGNRHYLLSDYYPYPYENGYLQAEEYPRLITGTDSFIPLGNTSEVNILSLSELNAFGLFGESSIGNLKPESEEVAGLYARNDWWITPVGEFSKEMRLDAGHAVYVTNGRMEDCPIRVGDTVSLAIRQDTSELFSDPEFMSLNGDPLLAYLLERMNYRYIRVVIDEVRSGSANNLILAEEDLLTVLAQSGVYTDLQIFLPTHVSMGAYIQFHAAIKKLVKQSGGNAVMTFDEQFITDAAIGAGANGILLRAMGIAAILIIPQLLIAAQFVFYGKRAEEFSIQIAIGRTPRQRRRLFFAESVLFAGFAGLTAAAICPLGYLFVLFLADTVKLPQTITGFHLPLYAALVVMVMGSCLLSGLLSYLRAGRDLSIDKKRAAKNRRSLSPNPFEKEGAS